jgi:mRNA-degrading endonuclease toxin of MazEF toxin-antitoxin module
MKNVKRKGINYMVNKFVRGQIWAVRTDIEKGNRVFSGEHISLILGVNKENTITIIPSTSKLNSENKILTTVELELTNLDGVTTVGHFIPNMVQTIDARKAYRYIGMLDKRSVMEVQKAVGKYLGFDKIKFEESFDKIKENENIAREEQTPIVKEEKQMPIAKEEKQKPIKIGRPVKAHAKIGDIRCFKGKEYIKKVDGKEKYNSIIAKWPKEVLDSIVEEYKNGSPKMAIAFEYGISDTKVGQYLRSRGLK